ncbi:hypothetical protein SAMN04244579_01667 [Azotobacter beijerinckii]|uniref:Glycosyltransferase RgtA/B/C/D-like domain-containing protein n=1 Tax=Azotobacter beijerinckii TaxID=170623 RepID=A0A1H6SQ06_9GAMM|nr:hypothetical protein [Azotobacter beijerinckii]SEI68946.1 hypothetical protein SAMN04244579_01667 [Azotobacter beijerinckii]
MKQYLCLRTLVAIYFVASLSALLYWDVRDRYTVTGDEPHYLIMASGFIKNKGFEQTSPYREEFISKRIYKYGLAPQEAEPGPENTHAVRGPHGLYNVHNIGTPLLLSVPFLLGGVLGSKVFMVALGSLAIVFIWRISGVFSSNDRARFFAILGVAVSLPLVPASGQIYPEIPAGIIILSGLYWFLTSNVYRSLFVEALWACVIAYLPWLQIKFGLVCAVLVIAVVAKIYWESRSLRRILPILVVALVSCLLLMSYNYYAFGKITGPYQAGAIEFSKTALMVLMGLHFDQNQGFLFQNPLLIVGLLFMGGLLSRDRVFALLCITIFLLLIVPNALHPNWYGGGSFSGRFAWAATMVFWIPAVYGLLQVFELSRSVFGCLVVSSLVLQAIFYVQYVFMGRDLYNKPASVPMEMYSALYSPISRWLPALYNSGWAFGYGVNFVWLSFLLICLVAGFFFSDFNSTDRRRFSVVVLLSTGLAILIAGSVSDHGV